MTDCTTDPIWVGMDVHQDSITAAILFPEPSEPQVERLPGDLNAVRRMFRRLSDHGPVRSCYEASGAGYVLQRALEHDGFHCEVIAPSLIPRNPRSPFHRQQEQLDAEASRMAEEASSRAERPSADGPGSAHGASRVPRSPEECRRCRDRPLCTATPLAQSGRGTVLFSWGEDADGDDHSDRARGHPALSDSTRSDGIRQIGPI